MAYFASSIFWPLFTVLIGFLEAPSFPAKEGGTASAVSNMFGNTVPIVSYLVVVGEIRRFHLRPVRGQSCRP